MHEDWLGTWDILEARVEEVHDAGDRVVVFWLQRLAGRGSGAPAEMRMAQIQTVRDGKVARIDNYIDRDEAMKAVGLGPQS